MAPRGMAAIGAAALVAVALGGCSAFDMRPCDEIRDEQYAALEEMWPEAVPLGRFSHGACDDSGDPAMVGARVPLPELKVPEIAAEFGSEGWQYDADAYGGEGAWRLDSGPNTFEASVYEDRGVTELWIVLE